MSDTTPRLNLPLLQAGQAQKEIDHNEALIRLDALVQPVVEAVALDLPPPGPATGQCWIVGNDPGGEWAGQPDAIACWSEGGWRFVAPADGMCLWSRGDGLWVRRTDGAWEIGSAPVSRIVIGGNQVVGPREPAITDPAGGATIDAEARVAIGQMLTALRHHGIIF